MAKKTKIILICAAALILAAAIVTTLCLVLAKPSEETPTDKTTISLNVNAYALTEDETFTIVATTNSTDVIKWTSSSPEVASVSSQGRVIAKTAGETTIMATVGNVSDSCRVQVVADNAQATIKLAQTTLRLSAASGAMQIQGTVVGGDSQQTLTEAGATYETDNASVATVSADGTVTPMSVGSTLVFVSANGRTKTVAVEVYTMLVSTAEDWNAMLGLPGDLAARFYVTNDIDFSGVTYNAKTNNGGDVLLSQSFCGSLDGGGHTISNVTFDSAVSSQSLFGTMVGCTLTNIAFSNIHFTASGAAGLAIRVLQHYNVADENGNATRELLFAPCYVTNVFGDFVYDYNGVSGITGIYYGGGMENVFVNMRMSDGSALNKTTDFAVAKQSMIWSMADPNWFPNNYLNNVVVLAERGAVNAAWDTQYDGAGLTIGLSGLHCVTTKMEAGYLVRTLFDNNMWTVTPGQLPELR
jgi:hypothetical protein